MLTSQKVIDAINEQIGYEFSASLQYYAIGAHFAAEALPQLSQHFFRQAEEEKGHALRFIKYVVDAGGRVVIPAIDAPESKFKIPRDAVKLSLDQEIHVTNQINGLVELARKANDYITINFLQWFLTEQLEEVSSMDNLLKIIERAGDDLLQADEYLARVGSKSDSRAGKVTHSTVAQEQAVASGLPPRQPPNTERRLIRASKTIFRSKRQVMRSSGRGIRKNYSTIWEASRRVVSSHGIAARGMDKQQLDWHQCSIASLRPMRVRSRSRTRSHIR